MQSMLFKPMPAGSTPRAAAGVVALAMTALTIGSLIVMPSRIDLHQPVAQTDATVASEANAPVAMSSGSAAIATRKADNEERVRDGQALLGAHNEHSKHRPSASRRGATT